MKHVASRRSGYVAFSNPTPQCTCPSSSELCAPCLVCVACCSLLTRLCSERGQQSRSSAIHPATNSKAPTHAASMPTLVSLFRDTTQPWPCATPSEYQYLSGCWMHSTTKPSCTVLRSSLLFSHANACVGSPAVGHLFTKSLNATVSLAEKP